MLQFGVLLVLTSVATSAMKKYEDGWKPHLKMTAEEIFSTFGTDPESVPVYKVISLPLPRRSKRAAGDRLRLHVELEEQDELYLELLPKKGQLLANRFTPIFTASSDPDAFEGIRYDPQPDVMDEVGEFTFYQDVKNKAAITVFDTDRGTFARGVLNNEYLLKDLSESAFTQILYEHSTNVVHISSGISKRDTDSHSIMQKHEALNINSTHHVSYHVIFKIPRLAETPPLITPYSLNISRGNVRFRRNPPWDFFPKVLVIADHNILRKSMAHTVKDLLAHWNVVDMTFADLDGLSVSFIISAIIISNDHTATPYFAKDTNVPLVSQMDHVIDRVAEYLWREKVRLPHDKYDMAVIHTRLDLYTKDKNIHNGIFGNANTLKPSFCFNETEFPEKKPQLAVASTKFDSQYTFAHVTAHELAHLFNVYHDPDDFGPCSEWDGFIMGSSIFLEHRFEFSPCSLERLKIFFLSGKHKCFYNIPSRLSVLPGRWLSRDAQCLNLGGTASCQIGNTLPCRKLGCKFVGSDHCVAQPHDPLPGSSCSVEKISYGNAAWPTMNNRYHYQSLFIALICVKMMILP